jgi:hypothetical protein
MAEAFIIMLLMRKRLSLVTLNIDVIFKNKNNRGGTHIEKVVGENTNNGECTPSYRLFVKTPTTVGQSNHTGCR